MVAWDSGQGSVLKGEIDVLSNVFMEAVNFPQADEWQTATCKEMEYL